MKQKRDKILLVEDDASVRQLLASRLKAAGFQVRTVADGAGAFELCRGEVPDLIILDILLPEIDGYTFLRKLRQELGIRHVPVIVLTAKDIGFRDICDMEEIQGYFTKPFRPEELIGRISSLLRPAAFHEGE